jgi:pSer/pThr/pTyr-binding forkhead associated (FHA) protein
VKHSNVPGEELFITVLNGPESGLAYRLLGNQISLGRDPDNDIVIQDNRASRQHARIEVRGAQYWIVDLGSQNGIFINGSYLRQKPLEPGDTLKFGDTELRFGPPTALSQASSHSMTHTPPLPEFDPGGGFQHTAYRTMPKAQPKFGLLFALIIVGAGAFWFLNQTVNKRRGLELRDEKAVETQLETISKTIETNEKEISAKGKDTQQYAEAQSFYLRGFREFREGNYGRAIQYLESALTLYPEHPLAKRYLSRSRLKFNEVVTQSLERGERYFISQKYQNAYNEYRTVILLLNDPANKSYQLAQKRIEAIQLIIKNNR